MRNKHSRVPDPNKIFSNPGNRYQTRYNATVDKKTGLVSLEPCGKIDIQEFINSFRDTTDLAYIVREIRRGNLSVLDQRTAFYGDFTSAPKDLMDFQQRVLDGQRAFYQLPVEVRSKYNNNMWLWMNDAGSEKWTETMKDYLSQKEVPVESEVKTDA